KLFGEYDLKEVKVRDISLEPYMNLSPILTPLTYGRNIKKQFWKSKKSVVERLMGRLMVAGHKGKKHWRTSNINTGKSITIYNIVKDAFSIIKQKTNKNPAQVLVEAIEHGSPREGITTIEYGGVRYPKPVEISPQRRVDLTLRWIAQSAFATSSSSKAKKSITQALANEIISTAKNDAANSVCIKKKIELERQAEASR
ncbi:MAG: 30S ribosomal protein S7, partial [Candidatus Woesearchaeota archaeon]